MKLYHGSTQIVKSPLVNFGRENLDFGKGFYTTDLKEQAEKWMGRFVALGKKCFVNVYDFNNQDIEKKYRYKKFSEYNEEWLDFIISCRSGNKDYINYDIIEGGIANDKVFNTIELYFANLIDKNTSLNRLKYEYPNNQICFVNQSVLECVLHFIGFYEIGISK
ncbi:MAG: DUF3990 domain-containing protein [Spirochaetales bacterium]|nr:DUF3990 domain-containing protein [Spirochaetales bacterium]